MSPRNAYARWAAKAGFLEDGHDSAYRGRIEGVDVWVDDGQRASGSYRVELRLELSLPAGERVGNVRISAEEDTPVREALREFAATDPRVVGVRLDRAVVTLRLGPSTPPDDAVEIARQTIALFRRSAAPYR